MSDDHHYDLVGYKMWAERGFDDPEDVRGSSLGGEPIVAR